MVGRIEVSSIVCKPPPGIWNSTWLGVEALGLGLAFE